MVNRVHAWKIGVVEKFEQMVKKKKAGKKKKKKTEDDTTTVFSMSRFFAVFGV